MSNEELKPCKFCGGKPDFYHDWSSENNQDFYSIGCFDTKCPGFVQRGAWDSEFHETGWLNSAEEAVEAWNEMN